MPRSRSQEGPVTAPGAGPCAFKKPGRLPGRPVPGKQGSWVEEAALGPPPCLVYEPHKPACPPRVWTDGPGGERGLDPESLCLGICVLSQACHHPATPFPKHVVRPLPGHLCCQRPGRRSPGSRVVAPCGDRAPCHSLGAACTEPEREELVQGVMAQVAEQFSRAFKLSELKAEVTSQLTVLERRVEVEALRAVEIEKCKTDIRRMREELAARSSRTTCPCKYSSVDSSRTLGPRRDVPTYPKYLLSPETVDALRKPTFDVWLWEPNEMLSCLEHMYQDLGLVRDFSIHPVTLRRWLMCVQDNYRQNSFHNFRHCFCVTQMMYSLVYVCGLQEKLSQLDILALMTAAICHDLDHPGFNNTYQVNARTELAVRYNDASPLENHHCAVAFRILAQPDCNILAGLAPERFRQIRQGIITLILATDMARHGEIMEAFKDAVAGFDFSNEEHRTLLKMILIKCCDISNEVRPPEVAEPWVDCLLEEYFTQSDQEKEEGLPVAPFMDREKVTKATAQIGFLKFVLIPMFEAVTELFPVVGEVMLKPLWAAKDRYEELRRSEDARTENREPLTLQNEPQPDRTEPQPQRIGQGDPGQDSAPSPKTPFLGTLTFPYEP